MTFAAFLALKISRIIYLVGAPNSPIRVTGGGTAWNQTPNTPRIAIGELCHLTVQDSDLGLYLYLSYLFETAQFAKVYPLHGSQTFLERRQHLVPALCADNGLASKEGYAL